MEDSPQNSPLKTPKTLGQKVPETPGAVRVCLIFFVASLVKSLLMITDQVLLVIQRKLRSSDTKRFIFRVIIETFSD